MIRTQKSPLCLAPLAALLTGCGRAPSVDIIGSFFPVWMLCLVVGVVVTFIVRIILVKLKLESEVGPLALFYPSLLALLSCIFWLTSLSVGQFDGTDF